MEVLFLRLCFLALLQDVAITSAEATGVVEVDLISPRNETYAPVDLMPIVFAIQNPQSAGILHLSLEWNIYFLGPLHGNSTYLPVIYGTFDDLNFLRSPNFTSNDPYFKPQGIEYLHEGFWLIQWELGARNCSQSYLSGPKFSGGIRTRGVFFTIKNGGQQPDLVVETEKGICENTPGWAFNTTKTFPDAQSADFFDYRPPCAVLSPKSPQPPLNPCAAKIVPSAASSISAAVRASACRYPNSKVNCPTAHNAVTGGAQSSAGGTAWMAAFLSWLTFVVA